MGYTKTVRTFTKACHQELVNIPIKMEVDAITFLRKMVNDELDELEEATSLVDQADALVDAIYYICDTAVKHGINLDPLFAIVHQANMQKLSAGKAKKRSDGKVLKPEGWQDPILKLKQEIERQCQEGAFTNGK